MISTACVFLLLPGDGIYDARRSGGWRAQSLEVQIHQILHGQPVDGRHHRQVQLLADGYGGGRVPNSHPPRPYSFGGDISLMGVGPESESEGDAHAVHARLSLMPYFAAQGR